MKVKRFNKIVSMILGLLALGLTSCEKYNDWEVDDSYNRLFRPSELTATVEGVTATLKFKGKPNTNSYKIELSKDSLQFNEIVNSYTAKVAKTADGYAFTVPDLLESTTRYSARIKGLDSTGTTSASEWSVVTFVTKTEQIMSAVAAADLATTSVTLRWTATPLVTHIMIGTERYDISATEKAAGAKTITGLTPETAYTATLYNNNAIRGSQSFKTLAVLPTGDDVYVVGENEDLAAVIQARTTNTRFVLLRNTVYKSDVIINIPNGLSISFWGQGGGNKPVLAFNGFNLAAVNGTIKFENIDLTGYQDNDPTKPKRSYIFNQSAASNTAEIIFDNCILRNFVNTPMRIQGANQIVIGKYTVNNCIAYDLGDNNANGTYAFIHVNTTNAASKISNIVVSNSTLYKVGYAFILHNTSSSESVLVENNTFYNIVGNARYFIDYNANTISTSFIFRNNIVAKTLSPLASARGIRAGTVPTVINSYKTSDVVFASNAIPNITDYTQSSASLFTNPDAGIFTIKDSSFEGKSTAGDPRWRQ